MRSMPGHVTIGGLGPVSTLWGSALDHVQGVEVVLTNSTIARGSEARNPDLFFVRILPASCLASYSPAIDRR